MNTEECKIQRSILVQQLVYYESMIEKFMKLKQIASDRLVRNEDLLTESESDEGGEYMEESETDLEGDDEEITIDRSQPFIVTPINKNTNSKSQVDYNEQMTRQLLGEKLMWDEKELFANADFFHASAYNAMGIPTKLFTPIFVCSRVSGWTAHVMEQRVNNRIIRPSADYIGEEPRSVVKIDER